MNNFNLKRIENSNHLSNIETKIFTCFPCFCAGSVHYCCVFHFVEWKMNPEIYFIVHSRDISNYVNSLLLVYWKCTQPINSNTRLQYNFNNTLTPRLLNTWSISRGKPSTFSLGTDMAINHMINVYNSCNFLSFRCKLSRYQNIKVCFAEK